MIREAIRTTVRGVGVVLLTAVEVMALSVWLGLMSDAAGLSTVAGLSTAAVGVVALSAGLLVGALLAHVTVNGWGRPVPGLAVGVIALAETAVWLGWFGAVQWVDNPFGVVVIGLVLAVALVPRHTVGDNALRGRTPLATLVQPTTVALGVLQAAGATAWFLVVAGPVAVPAWFVSVPVGGFSPTAVVGAALLTIAVFVRHLLAVRHALRPSRDSRDAGWRSSRGTPRD